MSKRLKSGITITVIAILVVFSIIAAVLLIDRNTELFANNRDGSITITYNNGHPEPGWEEITEQSVPLFKGKVDEDGNKLEPSKTRENHTKLLSGDTFERAGYNFIGWSTVKGYADAIVDGEFVPGGLTAYSKVTYYAIWEAKGFKISFNTDSSTVAAPTALDVTYNEQIRGLSDRALVNKPTNPLNIPEGWIFQGWFTQQDGNGQQFQDGDVFLELENITLYAFWERPGEGDNPFGTQNFYLRTSTGGTAWRTPSGRVSAGDYITITASPRTGYSVSEVWALEGAVYQPGYSTGDVRTVVITGTQDVYVTVYFESFINPPYPPDEYEYYYVDFYSRDYDSYTGEYYYGPFEDGTEVYCYGEVIELRMYDNEDGYIGYADWENYDIDLDGDGYYDGYYVFTHFTVNGYEYFPGYDFDTTLYVTVESDMEIGVYYEFVYFDYDYGYYY